MVVNEMRDVRGVWAFIKSSAVGGSKSPYLFVLFGVLFVNQDLVLFMTDETIPIIFNSMVLW